MYRGFDGLLPFGSSVALATPSASSPSLDLDGLAASARASAIASRSFVY